MRALSHYICSMRHARGDEDRQPVVRQDRRGGQVIEKPHDRACIRIGHLRKVEQRVDAATAQDRCPARVAHSADSG